MSPVFREARVGGSATMDVDMHTSRPTENLTRSRGTGVYLVTPDGGTEGVTAKHAEIDLENMRLHCWPANTSPEHGSFIVELEEGRALDHYVRGRVVWVGHELV